MCIHDTYPDPTHRCRSLNCILQLQDPLCWDRFVHVAADAINGTGVDLAPTLTNERSGSSSSTMLLWGLAAVAATVSISLIAVLGWKHVHILSRRLARGSVKYQPVVNQTELPLGSGGTWFQPQCCAMRCRMYVKDLHVSLGTAQGRSVMRCSTDAAFRGTSICCLLEVWHPMLDA